MSGSPWPTPRETTRPVTISWSPESWIRSSSHSANATTPSSIGAPVTGAGCQATPVNLSPPDALKERAKASWSLASMFTQKAPARAIRGQLVDDLAGASNTIGGSSDRAAKAWQVKPTGLSSVAVTTVTPLAKCPSTSRNRAASMLGGGTPGS